MYSVVRRHLSHVESFARGGLADLPFTFDAQGEEMVGWYNNPRPWHGDRVVFTAKAIWYAGPQGWTRVPFDAVVEYEMPASKTDAPGVRFRTEDSIHFVRFAGRSGPGGRYSDAFALVGILHAVVRANKRSEKRMK